IGENPIRHYQSPSKWTTRQMQSRGKREAMLFAAASRRPRARSARGSVFLARDGRNLPHQCLLVVRCFHEVMEVAGVCFLAHVASAMTWYRDQYRTAATVAPAEFLRDIQTGAPRH